MDAPRHPEIADPEFDPPRHPAVRLRDFDPREGQRLVVNPFLAAFGLIVWWELARWLLHSSFPPLAVATVLPLVLLPYLVQYHCLDCGKTGVFPRRDRHSCPALIARRAEAKRPRFPVPSAWSQLVVWAYILGSAALLYTISGAAPGEP